MLGDVGGQPQATETWEAPQARGLILELTAATFECVALNRYLPFTGWSRLL